MGSPPDVSCVIKLGGSLLSLQDLPLRLTSFLADFARPHPVIVCGGGRSVDLIREWDRLFHLQEEFCHFAALRALTLNGMVVAAAVPTLQFTERVEQFDEIWSNDGVPLYDAFAFVRDVDTHSSEPLPRRWRVTSDSIAARIATTLQAPELILLKSIPLEGELSYEEAARKGIVDPHFPMVACEVEKVSSVNLRAPEFTETGLYPAPSP